MQASVKQCQQAATDTPCAARPDADSTPPDKQALAARSVYIVAEQTFELMIRHGLSPDPRSYAVCFEYINQTNEALVEEFDSHVKRMGAIDEYIICDLYRAHIEDPNPSDVQQHVGLELECSLSLVSTLIESGAAQNQSYGESLKLTQDRIESVTSPGALESIVSELVVQNQEMSRAAEELEAELTDMHLQIETLNQTLGDLRDLTLRDPLTNVLNRRALKEKLKLEISSATDNSTPLCLVMADIDHFKRVNDSLGHQVGDDVLRYFTEHLDTQTGNQDLVARYGGEEFVIVLPGMGRVEAHNLIIRISNSFHAERFLSPEHHQVLGPLTASFGIATYKHGRDMSDLLECADALLYEAKKAGRNCVRTEGL